MKKAAKKKKKGTIDRSESFDEFLAKDGILAETEDAAVKEIIADQIKVAMDKNGLSKTAMAARRKTSSCASPKPAGLLYGAGLSLGRLKGSPGTVGW